MKNTRVYALACLTIPLVVGLAAVADELTFHPGKDAKTQKELRMEAEFKVEEASFTVNGEPMPGEVLDQVMAQEILLSLAIDATETFLATKDGKPTDLLRSYEKIKMSAEIGDETQQSDTPSELEGKSVRFTWNEKTKTFDKAFHESKGDEGELESLIDDMEVRALLPDKKVSEGDTWTIDATALESLFFPGGAISGQQDSGEGPDLDEMVESVGQQIQEALKDFRVTCTYKGTRDEGGARVGVIAFVYDGKADIDLVPMLEKLAESVGGEGVPEMDFTASAAMELEGEGLLLWDLAAGVMHSYEMKSKVGFDLNVQVHADQDGQQIEVSLAGSLGGNVTWEMKQAQ